MLPIRLIIAGSRDVTEYWKLLWCIEHFEEFYGPFPQVEEVISGGAPGVDTLAERWALEVGHPFHKEPAEWERYGRHKAGPIRNAAMARRASDWAGGGALLAIWDGSSPGTRNMLETAKNFGLEIFLFWTRNPYVFQDEQAALTPDKRALLTEWYGRRE